MAVSWIERHCVCGEGDSYGKLIKLRTDQKRFLYRWYEYCPNCAEWRYDEALRGAATGDGKTQFIACVVVLEFAGPREIAPPSPLIPIAAASFEQADRLFSAVAVICGGTDEKPVHESPLRGMFDVFDTEITFKDNTPGRIHRLAAVAGTNEGGLPTLFVCDELHEWGEPNKGKARVKTVVGKSTRKRTTPHGKGRIISLSTAGFDKESSLLGALCKMGERARHDPRHAPRFLYDWRCAPDGLKYERPADRERAVRAASAAADVLWKVRDRVADWGKPEYPPHEWLRYYANRWVDVPEDSWLVDHPSSWTNCLGRWSHRVAHPFVLSVDMALKRDSVAVVRVELVPGGRYAVTAKIWWPKKGKPIDHLEVFTYVLQQAKGSGFRGVVYDPRFFEIPSRMLADAGIDTVEFGQQPERMAPAVGYTYDRIIAGDIVHNGDPDFAAQVKGAVRRWQPDRTFTLSKSKSWERRVHIDGCVAMCMGVYVLQDVVANEESGDAWFAFG